MLIASFDIGEKNFAYCVAETIDNHLSIVNITHDNVIFKRNQTVIESCVRISTLIRADTRLMACDRFIIEQQMRCNTRAQRLAQHVWSTLHTLFPDRLVKFVPAHMKTQHFIGKNQLKDKERKTWSVVKVTQDGVMGESDRHKEIIAEIEKMKKKDDVCDTILQVIAYVHRDVKQQDEPTAKNKNRRARARTLGHEQDEQKSIHHEGRAEEESSQEV